MPARRGSTCLLLAALAQGQRQHPALTRAQHQTPRGGDVEPRRIALDMKHHGGKAGTACRLIGRPHRALQIARLDKRQPRRVEPVLDKARGEQPAAIAAGRGIVDPDDFAPAPPFPERQRRKRERKSRAGSNVAGQRATHFVQPAAGKPAVQTLIDRSRAQRDLGSLLQQAVRELPLAMSPGMGIQNIRRGPQSRKVHVTP
jgi:hypothetical protein